MKQDNKKLEAAFRKLGEEFKAELPPAYLRKAFKNGKVNKKQIYKTLEENINFEWIQGKWEKPTPPWIKDAIQQFESDLLTAMDPLNIWNVIPTSIRIPIFRDYLGSMETFIKSEIEDRDREWQKAMEESDPNPDLENGMPVEAQMLIPWIESAQDFAYVLRNSFFINLLAYAELFLVDRYRTNAKGKNREIPRSSVIKIISQNLVSPLKKAKIPGWAHVVHKYTSIRNCLVHNDGFLDDPRHENIRKYINETPSLSTSRMRNNYGASDIEYEKIILSKEFCAEALAIVEKFLLTVDFVANQLGQSGKPSKTDYLY
ncbi:MAG: hypothetical protein GY943_31565 [Chloroflexi bacterium]|nr:hypothetical protein [Chloroflexota bacterium]